jgi:hypothetical protein
MSLTVDQAYAQIKNLENTGQLTLPEPRDTVSVGSIDFATGAFTWNVPTFVKTLVIPPHPPVTKTNTIIDTTVGLVTTSAVDLILKFVLKNVPQRVVATARTVNVVTGGLGNITFSPPSGITIQGFPTTLNISGEIRVDAGLAVSSLLQTTTITPPVSTFSLLIKVPGHPDVPIEIVIARPPVLGLGAFTVPAVPITVIYAPPQGKQLKNSATYTDMTSFTRSVTTTVNQSNTVKTADAYTAADFISKIAGAVSTIAAIVGTGGAGAGAGGVAGALGALITSLVGNPAAQNEALSAGIH